jgi:hypothetical protein
MKPLQRSSCCRCTLGKEIAIFCVITTIRMIEEQKARVWRWKRLARVPYVGCRLLKLLTVQDIEDRLASLKNAAKYFGEHKDRAFEAKVSLSSGNTDV